MTSEKKYNNKVTHIGIKDLTFKHWSFLVIVPLIVACIVSYYTFSNPVKYSVMARLEVLEFDLGGISNTCGRSLNCAYVDAFIEEMAEVTQVESFKILRRDGTISFELIDLGRLELVKAAMDRHSDTATKALLEDLEHVVAIIESNLKDTFPESDYLSQILLNSYMLIAQIQQGVKYSKLSEFKIKKVPISYHALKYWLTFTIVTEIITCLLAFEIYNRFKAVND